MKNALVSDVPEKKEDFVDGEYTVSLPRPDARVAVKIIDMLGEETNSCHGIIPKPFEGKFLLENCTARTTD